MKGIYKSQSNNFVSMIILLSVQIFCVKSFYFPLAQPNTKQNLITKKCFDSTVYRQERLLIELELPVLKNRIDLGIEVALKNKQNRRNVIFTQIIKDMKFKKTISKQSHNVHQLKDGESMEYETCVFIKKRPTLKTQIKADYDPLSPGSAIGNNLGSSEQFESEPETYLISLKLLTNFSHILQQKRSNTSSKQQTHRYTKQNLQKLRQKSQKLLSIAKQQISIHRQNQKIELQTQTHLKDIQSSIYSMSLLQSSLLVFGSLMHINLMRTYMRNSRML